MTFSGCVEQWRLAVSVRVICFGTVAEEQLEEVFAAVPRQIEKACLVECVLLIDVALCLLDEVLRHLHRLRRLLDRTADKERILRAICFIHQEGYIVSLLEAKMRLL